MTLPNERPEFIKLGQIMQDTHGDEQLLESYGLDHPIDLGWIGWLAYQHGDINLDGTEN